MPSRLKDVIYTYTVEWADGLQTPVTAQSVEQAERIAGRKRFGEKVPSVPVMACWATNEDRARETRR